ncbi:MAG TPA: RAMP superfamily CRISPR-associated protein [Verrucomicrobiota bacterium]|nr:RAMP superfamily CRISPR-associated protein [Verrucomicrobiota bacterium]
MKTARLRLELLGWWHAGSGHSRGGDADALVIRDADGLPHLPGRTVKGLLRDACRLVHAHQHSGQPDRWFGLPEPVNTQHPPAEPPSQTELSDRPPGALRFGDARLPEPERAWFAGEAQEQARRALFPTLTTTALTERGVTRPQTLRTLEVAPPLPLQAEIPGPDDPAWVDELATAARLIRHLGSHRHRGLGRCRASLVCDPAPPAAATPPGAANAPASATPPPAAGSQWLEIELLSDVIFSAHGATLGIHQTLDYVPGSALLGTAAGPLFRDAKDKAAVAEALLGGGLRFGDGLPVAADGATGWPVPGTFRVLKVSAGPAGRLALINALTDTRRAAEQRGQPDQPLRRGGGTAAGGRFHPETHFALKSARAPGKFGRAADAQLFGYARLRAGQRFRACLRWDAAQAAQAAAVLDTLTRGHLALGRSRSAEFGTAQVIRVEPPPLPDERPDGPAIPGETAAHITFYLASDLALERDGLPLLDPAAAMADFGLPAGSAQAWANQNEQVGVDMVALVFAGENPQMVHNFVATVMRHLGI